MHFWNFLPYVVFPNICWKFETAGNFSLTERITVKYVGAAAMYLVSKKLKKRHNITDERRALYDLVETWLNAIDGRDFLGDHSIIF